ncbi:phosphoribosylglycinamide formyltransferase [Larsenimonas suaedae]|uniref:Phosphoribosylglycinamide formyltransferase n=1 Tax=Larsenimonas suaedae TaxID=1851019 RepID=A0ABU1GZX8_9GAMM|nr:phosphoribosylglycinamide formyltransferase [Larsenimonas suaedae]MCM2971592.1 phosphoribosylglycinamide formyltransferase [Larsenimonas suaedae]MDR5896848.1 phosphoribosylglycinamide formyltransferase [Larsenimonas suaedae]
MTFEAETADARRIVVLISGSGSNLQALLDAMEHDELGGNVVAVISNKPDAYGLERAKEADVLTEVVEPSKFRHFHDERDRELYDAELIRVIDHHQPDLVVLAGFMRILTKSFVLRYHGRLMNIHPSLLPAYKGLDTHARLLADSGTEHGASVHFVTEELDGGPIIVQAAVHVLPDDTKDTLAERVLSREHLIYPMAVRWFLDGRLQLNDSGLTLDGHALPASGLRLAADDVTDDDL